MKKIGVPPPPKKEKKKKKSLELSWYTIAIEWINLLSFLIVELLIFSLISNSINAFKSFNIDNICNLVEIFCSQDFIKQKKKKKKEAHTRLQLWHYDFDLKLSWHNSSATPIQNFWLRHWT